MLTAFKRIIPNKNRTLIHRLNSLMYFSMKLLEIIICILYNCSTNVIQERGAFIMSTLTIRLNEEEKTIFQNVAGLYGGKLSTTIKQLALEKLEDEYDLQLMKEYEERKERNEVKYVSFEDMKEVFEI